MDFTEYALRRSQVPANDLSLSIHSPVLIYSFLAAYGLLTILMLIYVRAKFRSAAKTLNLLQAEWQSARSTHESFVGAAHEQLSKLIAPKPASNFPQRNTAVNFDVRNEVIAMAKRGIAPPEIARSCGVTEGEVEIVLGIIRLQRRSDTDMRERLDQKTGD